MLFLKIKEIKAVIIPKNPKIEKFDIADCRAVAPARISKGIKMTMSTMLDKRPVLLASTDTKESANRKYITKLFVSVLTTNLGPSHNKVGKNKADGNIAYCNMLKDNKKLYGFIRLNKLGPPNRS